MAEINITLNQAEILELLGNSQGDAFKHILEKSLNSFMKAESNEQIGAEEYERTEKRKDSRNGTRERKLVTRLGTLVLEVPRHRNVPFKTLVFENYARTEQALISVMAEMVINGVSTKKVSTVMEQLCEASFSKSTVSEVCKTLDEQVEEFRNRQLTEEYPFVIIDATYFKTRVAGRTISQAFCMAIGITRNGKQELIGFGLYDNESNETWSDFLSTLKRRGLHGVKVITTDAHPGMLHAITHEFPSVPWQRCQFHFTRNIVDKAPKKFRPGLQSELTEMFNAPSLEMARQKKDEILHDYGELEAAMECLENGFESAMTVMYLPAELRRAVRTSNRIERVNRELKRRSKAIGVFPNPASILRLMGAVAMEENERMQGRSRLFYKPAIEAADKSADDLICLAQEQHRWQMAA